MNGRLGYRQTTSTLPPHLGRAVNDYRYDVVAPINHHDHNHNAAAAVILPNNSRTPPSFPRPSDVLYMSAS